MAKRRLRYEEYKIIDDFVKCVRDGRHIKQKSGLNCCGLYSTGEIYSLEAMCPLLGEKRDNYVCRRGLD